MANKEQPMIYVVMGQTGEYSDHREWFLEAWPTEKQAQDRVALLENILRTHNLHQDSKLPDWDDRKKAEEAAKQETGDDELAVDYTGTTYYCVGVPWKGGAL